MATNFLHVLVYGQSGAGKSTFAATFPTPQLVYLFDPASKVVPYLSGGIDSGIMPPDSASNVPWQEVYDDRGLPIRRIEYYLDADPSTPTGFQLFLSNFIRTHTLLQRRFRGDAEAAAFAPWATIIFDSMTKLELMARKVAQYKLNAGAKDPRQWYGYSTEALEETLDFRICSLPCNAVVICHTDKDKSEYAGLQVKGPNLPGRLQGNSPSSFGELYHLSLTRGEKGEMIRALQTQGDQLFVANTMIQAPNFCYPSYQSIIGKNDTK